MKFAYDTKLVKKGTKEFDVLVEDMESDGWATHRVLDNAVVFRRSVPENYVRAWFVVDWETKDGGQVEVRHGPYFKEVDALAVVDPTITLRVEKTWIPPADTGTRMDRVAWLTAAEPSDPPPIETNPPKTKKTSPVTPNTSAPRAVDDLIDDMAFGETEGGHLRRIRDFIADTNAASRPVPPRPPRRSSPVGVAPRGSRRPSAPTVNTGLLDAMRQATGAPARPVEPARDPDEPTDGDIRVLAENLRRVQASRRHDQ